MADAVTPPAEPVSVVSAGRLRFRALPRLLGIFLLATAWMKVLAPAETASFQSAYDLPYWLLSVGIQLELFVGLLLVGALWLPWAWAAAIVLFASFAGISLLRALAGLESCGCFGAIRVNPWMTLTIDLAILAALWAGRRQFFEGAQATDWRRARGWLVACLLMVVGSLVMLSANHPERLFASTPLLNDEGLVILEPSEWIGKPLPLLPYLDPKFDLSAGRWIVVLYHHDCPKCQSALPEYERLASGARQSLAGNVLAVEVPPFGDQLHGDAAALKHARLSESREWFVEAPIEIQLQDGVVTAASLDLPSLDAAAIPHSL
jgi:hypothetical protein